jgi:hypothetical protein
LPDRCAQHRANPHVQNLGRTDLGASDVAAVRGRDRPPVDREHRQRDGEGEQNDDAQPAGAPRDVARREEGRDRRRRARAHLDPRQAGSNREEADGQRDQPGASNQRVGPAYRARRFRPRRARRLRRRWPTTAPGGPAATGAPQLLEQVR